MPVRSWALSLLFACFAAAVGGQSVFANGTARVQSSVDGLKAALAQYRTIESQGGWPVLPDGPALRPGSSGPGIDRLQRRLAATGDLTDASAFPAVFDARLSAAVMRFQARHGLDVDGIVGRRTRAALNVSVDARVRQIEANIVRLQTMPEDNGDRFVLINVAAFDLAVFEDGRPVFRSPVVVGRVSRPTPTFSSTVTHIVTHPSWRIPRRIAVLDILPKVRRDPAYLSQQSIRVFGTVNGERVELSAGSIDWRRLHADNFPYLLVQDPGPLNALGRIKFFIPNEQDIYLHDTPLRDLFRRPVRSFSSGCIRVERAQELAELLLSQDDGERLKALAEALEKGETSEIPLAAPVPVHIVYLTAWTDQDGVLHFRDDIYGLDGPAGAATAGNGRLRQSVAVVNQNSRGERCGAPPFPGGDSP
jgi:murein L,D-transpeptidase YcbB/YkuD